jgi:hypothetical protein
VPDQALPTPPAAAAEQPKPAPAARQTVQQAVHLPEKEIVKIEFKNLSHELSHDPVVNKLWAKIARFTSDLKKETFGGREGEGIFFLSSLLSPHYLLLHSYLCRRCFWRQSKHSHYSRIATISF